MKQQKSLLVTLADKNYIQQAKVLFSSVYFNAGWKGDYMLLSHEIPEKELKWFKDKGILVKKCLSISKKNFKDYPKTVLDKFYLFTPEFKKWKNIVYLDADIIVRGSLNKLTKVKGFSAAKDIYNNRIGINFTEKNKKKLIALKKECNLNKIGFNSGVIAFNTKIINKSLTNNINSIIKRYFEIANGDQPLLNIIFQNQLSFLPREYNVYIPNNSSLYKKISEMKGIITLHFCGIDKPWLKNSSFYKEWTDFLKMAELIDLSYIPTGKIIKKPDITELNNYLDSVKDEIDKNRNLAELYKLGEMKKYRQLLLKCIKENGIAKWKREAFYYLAGFVPKSMKIKIKNLIIK